MEWTYGRIYSLIAYIFGLTVAAYYIFFHHKNKKKYLD